MNIVVRLLWFVFIGWWAGVLWFLLASVVALTVIWYNVGLFMVIHTWDVMTLKAPLRETVDTVRQVR